MDGMKNSIGRTSRVRSVRMLISSGGIALLMLLLTGGTLTAQKDDSILDITGRYHFVSADGVLALLDEEGKLNGYIDIIQGEDESDSILSYPISEGSRKKSQVEFKTRRVHQKYFRFRGTVERGEGHVDPDPDYLRLVGDLEIVTVKGESGEEAVQRMHVVFKSVGRDADQEQ